MENHNVKIEITDQIAKIEIEEVFFNNSNTSFEVIYMFPIPDNSIISDFKLTDKNGVLEGKVMEKQLANEYFRHYASINKNPGIMEFVDDTLYGIRIAGFQPFERRTLKVTYQSSLEYDGSYLKLVYPLKIDSILLKGIDKVNITGSVKNSREIYSVFSPAYSIMTESLSPYEKDFSFVAENLDPNHDFTLLIALGERDFEAFLNNHESEEDEGYFELDLYPSIKNQNTVRKNLFMVLDRSGSMYGQKYTQALDAAEYIIKRLGTEDYFNLLLFNDYVKNISEEVSDYDSLINLMRNYQAESGTNIYAALNIALNKLLENDSNNYIIFLTDGLPTVGITMESVILKNSLSKAEMGNTKMFVFGVGYDVNTNILDILAEESGGMAFYVEEDENIESIVSDLYNKISRPLLTDVEVKIESDNVIFKDIFPFKNLTVYESQPLKIFGKYSGQGQFKVTVSGNAGAQKFTEEYIFELKTQKNDYIPKLWASRKIKYLINNIKLNGETEELVDEVVKLGTDFGIITPYTSYLLYSHLPEEQLDGVESYMDIGKGSLPSSPGNTGMDAFKSSKIMNRQSQSLNLQEMEEASESSDDIVAVNGKVFFYSENDEFWIDMDFSEEDEVTVKAYSDEYFTLISENSEILDFLKLGNKIKLNYYGQNLIIKAE